jgi:hypothetical protein
MASDQPRKHHYVPQAYLKRFAVQDQVFVFDKQNEQTFKTNVLNIAAERDFYRIPDKAVSSEINSYALESALSEIEIEHQQALDALVKYVDSSQEISRELRLGVARAIVFQYLRTQQMRVRISEGLNDFRDQLTKLLLPPMKSLNEDSIQFEHDENASREYAKSNHLLLTINLRLVETLATILTDYHQWSVVQNMTELSFITSDSPVILDSIIKGSPIFGNTFGSLGARVLFPVNPKLLIWTNQRDQQTKPILQQNMNEIQIKAMNTAQVIKIERWVYSLDGNFSSIQEMKTEQ